MTRDEPIHPQSKGAEMPSTTDPMTTLAAQIGVLAEDGYRRRRGADLADIVSGARGPAGAARKAGRARWRPLLAGTAVAAVAATAIAVPVVRSGHSGAPLHPVPPRALDARSFLLASADVSEKAPATAHGNYWYTRIQRVDRARQPSRRPGAGPGSSANGGPRSGPYFPFRAYVSITWENWDPYRQGQPSRMVDRDIKATFATPADKAAWQRAGSPSLSDMKPFSTDSRYDEPFLELGPKGTKMADLPKLPVTPAGLKKLVRADREQRLRQLRKAHAGSQELSYREDVYQAAVGIITAPTTPKVRAAAYRMLAGQRGIRSLGEVRDGLGRRGVALAVRLDRRTSTGNQKGEEHLIIDPASARVLAKEFHPIGADGKAESLPSESTLMIGDGWTDRIGVPARH